MQIPIGAEDNFEGVVDLVTMKAIYWDVESQGMKFEYRDIPANLMEQAQEARASFMVEAAAETIRRADEQVPRRRRAHRRRDHRGHSHGHAVDIKIIPVFCGSAFKNKGVQALLDAVVAASAVAVDRPPVKGIDENDKEDTREPATTSRSPRSRSRS